MSTASEPIQTKLEPLVSVVMPAYNAEIWIKSAIESILAQSYKNWELLILDDASTDATRDIIYSFLDARIKLIINKKNEGYLKSCNTLFARCRGSYITFLDADDTCAPNRLERCVQAIESDPKTVALITAHTRTYPSGKVELRNEDIDPNRLATDSNYTTTLCGATLFAKADGLREAGCYHPIFEKTGAEDHHLIFRLALLGHVAYLPEPLYTYRIHRSAVKASLLSPERHIGHDLERRIRQNLILGQRDLLDSSNRQQLQVLYYSGLFAFQDDPALIYRKASISELNMSEWAESFRHSRTALALKPLSLINWKHFARIVYIMLRRSLAR